jgi:hypothetical protein
VLGEADAQVLGVLPEKVKQIFYNNNIKFINVVFVAVS